MRLRYPLCDLATGACTVTVTRYRWRPTIPTPGKFTLMPDARDRGEPGAGRPARRVRRAAWGNGPAETPTPRPRPTQLDRRNFILASSGYALSALGLPDMDSITRRTTTAPPGAVRVGRGEVAAVRHMVKALGDSASELGGGHARHLAVRYLTQDVAPWLEGRFTEATGRELFAATSQLVHLMRLDGPGRRRHPRAARARPALLRPLLPPGRRRPATPSCPPQHSEASPSSASTSATEPKPSSSAKPA